VTNEWEKLTERFSPVKQTLRIQDMTGKETFEKGERLSQKGVAFQVGIKKNT
jgi:hypothetical protein